MNLKRWFRDHHLRLLLLSIPFMVLLFSGNHGRLL